MLPSLPCWRGGQQGTRRDASLPTYHVLPTQPSIIKLLPLPTLPTSSSGQGGFRQDQAALENSDEGEPNCAVFPELLPEHTSRPDHELNCSAEVLPVSSHSCSLRPTDAGEGYAGRAGCRGLEERGRGPEVHSPLRGRGEPWTPAWSRIVNPTVNPYTTRGGRYKVWRRGLRLHRSRKHLVLSLTPPMLLGRGKGGMRSMGCSEGCLPTSTLRLCLTEP